MSAPTALIAESTSKRNLEPSESPSPPSAKRPRSEDLTSLKVDAREVFECASPPSEETPRSENSFPPLEGVSQVRDGQKPPAATADTTTAMSESTLRIIAEKQKGPASLPDDTKWTTSFWGKMTMAEHKLYYEETGQVIRNLLLSILPRFS